MDADRGRDPGAEPERRLAPEFGDPRESADPRPVEVRRSGRRNRTVTAYRERDRTVVLIPDHFDSAAERVWVDRMEARLREQERRRSPDPAELLRRAVELSERHLDGRALPSSVQWSDRQLHRWGSCSPDDRSIRLSTRLRGMPGWVLDYVLLHELAHLLEDRHSPAFWDLLARYPRTERARGYLEGFEAARNPDGPAAGVSEESADE